MISSIFLNDWFERNDEYILKNTDIEIGFADIPNKKYSSFLYDENKAEKICTDNKLLIAEMKDMINAIGCKSINFKFDKSLDTAATDGKTVCVGTANIGTSISDYYETIDRIIGMTIHETCHCLYTDFSYIKSNRKRFKSSVVHYIHNIIEDEMIENKLCLKFPGYSNFLAKLKYNIFELEESEDNDNSEVGTLLRILFYLIRYPKLIANINEDVLNEYEHHIVKIKKIMDDIDCFNSSLPAMTITKRSVEAAIKIWDYICKNIKVDSDNENESNDKNESGDPENNENSENNNSNSNSNNSEDNDSDEEESNEKESDNKESDNKKSNDKKSKKSKKEIEVKNTEEDALNSDIIKKTLKTLEKISSDSEVIEKTDMILSIHKILDEATNYSDSDFKWDHNTETNINVREIRDGMLENRHTYNEYFNEMKDYLSLARNLIIQNNVKKELNTIRFKRNGTLDPTRLANAMCNEQTVYNQKSMTIKNNNPKYALIIMLDESGSMEHMNLNILASKFAILMYEALSKYKDIQLFVYGHGDCVYRYITPTKNNKYVLGSRYAQGGQDEVRSYQLIIEDVKNQTNLPIIVFNITDSCYCSNISKLERVVHNYINDTSRKISFNLFVLGHGYRGSESPYNDSIYGKDNWLVYNSNGISKSFDITLNIFAKIIKRNFNIKNIDKNIKD